MVVDHVPAEVPIQPAATVMLLADRPGAGSPAAGSITAPSAGAEARLHVLLLHRTARLVFGPGNWVFPGGRVDPDDHLDEVDRLCRGLSDREASRLLGVEQGGLAWWIAACRETLEEAGLLLGAPSPTPADLAQLRDRVRTDEGAFIDLLLAGGITLDMTGIEEVGRFVTPPGPPRRFDARFFVARAPDDQATEHDNSEIVASTWIEPAAALARWRTGEMTMMAPTVRMLACLARFSSADEVIDLAQTRPPYRRVRVIDPDDRYEIVLPGEPGYETAEIEVETGWVRLWSAP